MSVGFEVAAIGTLFEIARRVGVPNHELGAIALLAIFVGWMYPAYANPLDRPDVKWWLDSGKHSPEEIERNATHDFAKCLVVQKGNKNAVLDCATQVLDANGVPRRAANTSPSAGRAAMLIATADNPQKPVASLGSTTWSLIPPMSGQPVTVAVKVEADIPDLKMHATMTLRKNTDPTLKATHTIDLKFSFADGAAITGFKDVGLPQMRKEDSTTADALTSVKLKISGTYFLIALAKGDTYTARNLDLMKTRASFDFPLLLNDDRIAKVVFQKSPEGQAMLDTAFEAWNAAVSEPLVPAGKMMEPPVSTDKPPEPPVSGKTSAAVPFINHRGRIAVNVLVGGHAVQMILDTGADISQIPSALADQLIAEGHATKGSGGNISLADGSSHYQRRVIVGAVTIGNHTRSLVEMTVSNGEPLLGLPELNAIGKFTIDTQHGVLTFSSPSR
jgi:hypothetical protein